MKTISLRLDARTAAWLEMEAKRRTRSKSVIVRELLEEKQRVAGKSSVHERMRDLCGSLKRQPRDVSKNLRKYLQGLGE